MTTQISSLANPAELLLKVEEKFLSEILVQDLVPDAFLTCRKFEPVVKGKARVRDETLRGRYSVLYWKMKFVAIPMLEEEEIIGLLRDYFPVVFELGEDYDLIDKIRTRLVGLAAYDHRDEFKTRLRLALMHSPATLTQLPFQIIGKEQPGTIANWLTDAQRQLGSEAIPQTKIEEYLASSDTGKHLDSIERDRVRRLLRFVEYTKKSSRTPAGLEERLGIFERGRIHKVMDEQGNFVEVETDYLRKLAQVAQAALGGPPVPFKAPGEAVISIPLLTDQSILKISSTSGSVGLDSRQIQSEEETMQQEKNVEQGGSKVRFFIDHLQDALRVHKQERAIAAIRLLARANAVGLLLAQEKNIGIRQEFVDNLKKKYGEAYGLAFEAHPDRIQFQTAFLDWLFRDKLQLSDEESDEQRKVIVALIG